MYVKHFVLTWLQTCFHSFPFVCGHCRKLGVFKYHFSRTAYYFKGKRNSKEDPNRASFLCAQCRDEDIQYWDDMWAEYWNGVL